MKQVILPTAGIIERYRPYDDLFWYGDGLTGFVRDSVLFHDCYREEYAEYRLSEPLSGPAQRVLQAWRDSPDGMAARHLSNGTSREDMVCGITERITEEVDQMLLELFLWPSGMYDIDPKASQWLGDDLLVQVQTRPILPYFFFPRSVDVPVLHHPRHAPAFPVLRECHAV